MVTPTVTARLTQDNLPGLLQRLRPRLELVVSKAAHDVEAHAKREILSGQKSGIVIVRRGVEHQASAPGESPANDLGNLAAGIAVGDGEHALQKVVRSNAEYSADLEMGTTRMAARPFLGPALESVRAPMTAAANKVVAGK